MSDTELERARQEILEYRHNHDLCSLQMCGMGRRLADFERLVRADERAKVEKEVRAETFENGAW